MPFNFLLITYNDEILSHYITIVQAVPGQVAARGGAEHLEQFACLQIPSVIKAAGIGNGHYHNGMPAITGWWLE